MTRATRNPPAGSFKDQALIRSNKRVLASRFAGASDFSTPTIKAIYSLKAGGMGATLSNGQKVRLIAPALGHVMPRLGQSLEPDQFESL